MRVLVGFWISLALLAAQPAHAAIQYVHTDALGSPVAVTDEERNVLEHDEYEPYGKVLSGAVKDGPGFTGHVSDAATGLSYMQQRYYDPAIGRFLSVDPVTADGTTGTNFNRYWYANDNPYRFTDPDGRFPLVPAVIFFVIAMTHSEPANAPAPGERTQGSSPADALDAVPGGGPAIRGTKMAVRAADRYRRADYKYRSNNPAARAAREAGEGKPCPKCGEPMVSGTNTAPQAQHEPSLSEKHYEGGGASMTSAEKKAYANSSGSLNGANCRTCQAREGAAQRGYVKEQEIKRSRTDE